MENMTEKYSPIGVFDSGFGGLTILKQFRRYMPEYDYMFLGDNARAPYGSHSFEVVYEYTLQCVKELFSRGCQLVILACNTASAKALRSIQQNDLPKIDPSRRVLGVIRPTVEVIGNITETKHVGVFATEGTIRSGSYGLELKKLYPEIVVTGEACPMWVHLVENKEYDSPGADYFVKKRINNILSRDSEIDTLILACTHYPLLINKIKQYVPEHIKLVPQGEYVAASLKDYLCRHQDMNNKLSKGGTSTFLTTESEEKFSDSASIFLEDKTLTAKRIFLH